MALAAAIALLAPVGCGSEADEPGPGVPRATADALARELDLVDERLEVTRQRGEIGACNDIESKSYPDIERLVEGLPQDTDEDVRGALEQSIDRLRELTESECSELADRIKRREETTPTVTTPPPPPVQPQQTTPEQTVTEEEPQEKTTEEKPEKPKQNGGTSPQDKSNPGKGGGGQPAPPPEDG